VGSAALAVQLPLVDEARIVPLSVIAVPKLKIPPPLAAPLPEKVLLTTVTVLPL
jgi:hypothetical protein